MELIGSVGRRSGAEEGGIVNAPEPPTDRIWRAILMRDDVFSFIQFAATAGGETMRADGFAELRSADFFTSCVIITLAPLLNSTQ